MKKLLIVSMILAGLSAVAFADEDTANTANTQENADWVFTCWEVGANGMTFYGNGPTPYIAGQMANAACFDSGDAPCVPTGCN